MPPSASSAAPTASAAIDDKRRAGTAANFANASPHQREMGIQQCEAKGDDCDQADVLGVEDSAKSDGERAHLVDVNKAAILQHEASEGSDGTDMDGPVVVGAAATLAEGGAKLLTLIPTTTFGAAMKDIAKERGKVLNVSGTIGEIQADRSTGATLYQGSVVTDSGNVVRFVCPLSTDGIEADKRARFRGVVVQEYDFSNVGGGTTKSILAVGALNP